MTVLGTGLDLVHLPAFAEQLADPASGFVAATFTPRELGDVASAGERRTASLGGRFAAKEAFVKAWSAARFGHPPALAVVDLREIEAAPDGWGRPALRLRGAVAAAVAELAGPDEAVAVHLSLTHDGPTAAAVVIVERRTVPERL